MFSMRRGTMVYVLAKKLHCAMAVVTAEVCVFVHQCFSNALRLPEGDPLAFNYALSLDLAFV